MTSSVRLNFARPPTARGSFGPFLFFPPTSLHPSRGPDFSLFSGGATVGEERFLQPRAMGEKELDRIVGGSSWGVARETDHGRGGNRKEGVKARGLSSLGDRPERKGGSF